MAEIELEDGTRAPVADVAALRTYLTRLSPDAINFAILSSAPEVYVQAFCDAKGFTIERRDGTRCVHYSAARPTSPSTPQQAGKWWQFWKQPKQDRFDLDEVLRIFSAFLDNEPMPPFVKWVKLEFSR